jgi:hypothetical protein
MEWYWYLVIGFALVGMAILKRMMWNKIRAKRKEKEERKPAEED